MRCFVAVELSDEIRRQLGALQRRHAALDRAVRWTPPEQIHLTLKFLGDVPDSLLPQVCAAMESAAESQSPVEFEVKGAGCFPPGGAPRVFWAGVEEPSGALARLRDACEAAFVPLGYPRENRAFSPHLTLARVKDFRAGRSIRDAAAREAGFRAGRQRAGEIILFESVLAPAGATYRPLARAPLGGAPRTSGA
jgi:2'-5' RNA ligase